VGVSLLVSDGSLTINEGGIHDLTGTLRFGTLTITAGSILDESTGINFGDTELTTTGDVTFNVLTLNGPLDMVGENIRVNDNILYFGLGEEAAIYYDGNDLIIDPKVVGTGVVDLNGGNLTTTGTGTFGAGTGDDAITIAEGSYLRIGSTAADPTTSEIWRQ